VFCGGMFTWSPPLTPSLSRFTFLFPIRTAPHSRPVLCVQGSFKSEFGTCLYPYFTPTSSVRFLPPLESSFLFFCSRPLPPLSSVSHSGRVKPPTLISTSDEVRAPIIEWEVCFPHAQMFLGSSPCHLFFVTLLFLTRVYPCPEPYPAPRSFSARTSLSTNFRPSAMFKFFPLFLDQAACELSSVRVSFHADTLPPLFFSFSPPDFTFLFFPCVNPQQVLGLSYLSSQVFFSLPGNMPS